LTPATHAIAYAHSRGVIHRDLKPANIMLGPFGETLVVDWGVAKASPLIDLTSGDISESLSQPFRSATGTTVERTKNGAVVGTPAYMSPEQAASDHGAVSYSSDDYSLGATLHELLVGHPPFEGTNLNALLTSIIAGRLVSPKHQRSEVPAPLDAICMKAMARDPMKRYSGARELAHEVERWLADDEVAAYPEPIAIRARRWAARNMSLFLGAAALQTTAFALLLSLSACAMWLLFQAGTEGAELQAVLSKANPKLDDIPDSAFPVPDGKTTPNIPESATEIYISALREAGKENRSHGDSALTV
jgi:serine/threonine protein kinase